MRFLLAPAFAGLAACSTLPNAAKMSEFGKAVTDSSAVLQDALDMSGRVAAQTEIERQARRVVRRQSTGIGVAPAPLLEPERVALRLQAVRALRDYGKALAEAADKGNVDELEAAAGRVGNAVAQFAAVASPAAAPIAAPAIRLAARGFGSLLASVYAAEIQAIIRSRDAQIALLADLLRQDLEGLAVLLKLQVNLYANERLGTYSAVRDDRSVDRLRLYDEFRRAQQELDAMKASLAALERFGGALQALRDTHHALATSEPDGDVVLRRFLGAVEDLAALAAAIRRN